MTCSRCGKQIADGCSCVEQDLMGFLSDFRSAAASTAPSEPDSPTARRVTPAVAREPQEDVPYYAPTNPAPNASPAPTTDIAYYAPPQSSDTPMATPTWAPPSNDGTYWALPLANETSPYPSSAYPAPSSRRQPIWIIGAVVAAVAVIAGVGAMFGMKSSPSLNGLTADQVMAKMVAAAHKARTFHVEVTESQDGNATHTSMDIGSSGGNFDSSTGGHTATVRVVGGGVYLKADETALIRFGFPNAQAQQYAGQWLTVPTNSPDIQQMMQSTDANKIIDQFLHLSGPLTRMSSGQAGVTIQGTVPDNDFNQGSGAGDTANLVVSNREPFVPLSISFSDPSNGSTQMSFSRWGEPVVLTVPPNAVSLLPGGGSS